ncbi:MAG TPA: hypothetical protein PKK43_00450 [Spirochaetota bacterium]|nr:hypothetical protein [Spirochaetota bacterium]
MTYLISGLCGRLFNIFIVMCFLFACVVIAFEGAVFRGYISFSHPAAVLAAKNIIFFIVIFFLLVRYVKSNFSPADNAGSGRMVAAYAAHMIKTAVMIGIPLKIVILLYLKYASDDFGIDRILAFNGNGWLSFAYNAVILSVMIIGFGVVNNTGSSSGSLVKALRFVFTRNGAVVIPVLAAFFAAVAVSDHLVRLIEYRTVISLIVDSVVLPFRYCLLFFVVYAVSAIIENTKGRNPHVIS